MIGASKWLHPRPEHFIPETFPELPNNCMGSSMYSTVDAAANAPIPDREKLKATQAGRKDMLGSAQWWRKQTVEQQELISVTQACAHLQAAELEPSVPFIHAGNCAGFRESKREGDRR